VRLWDFIPNGEWSSAGWVCGLWRPAPYCHSFKLRCVQSLSRRLLHIPGDRSHRLPEL